jgi:hypothetical protein
LALPFAGALFCCLSHLLADSLNSGTVIDSPSNIYQAPAAPLDPTTGIEAPSGTYWTPTASLVPATSSRNAPVWEGGHLPFLVSASLSEVYDDNIFIQPQKTSDLITQINLKGEYRAGKQAASDGNYLDAYYAPSFDLYADHSRQDSFNQLADVFYQHRFSKLDLSLEQEYVHQRETSAAAGNLVTASVYTTNASADYAYSDKLTMTSNFTQRVTDFETSGYSSSNEWVEDAFFLYKLDSKLSIGLGPRFGWLDVTEAANQAYQDILGRLTYNYSGKLTFNVAVGVEYREYQGSATGDQIEPVFNLAGTYKPFIHTTLTLSGGRAFNPSYDFHSQDYIATTVSLTARQRFLQTFYYNLGMGYENDSYQGAGVVVTGPNRNDDYYFVTTGFDWQPNNWLMSSLFYRYQRDDSNLASSRFTDDQVGLSVSASY